LIFHPLPTLGSPRRVRLSADEPPEATLKGEEPAIIPSPLEGEGKGEGDHLCLYYYANLECKVVDEKMVAKYNFFILKVLKAWIDPTRKDPRTIHHRGRGIFMVAGETIKLPSKMK
jgi:hypothetical protein